MVFGRVMSDFRKVKMRATAIHLAEAVPEAHWNDLLSETSWSPDERMEIMRLARERAVVHRSGTDTSHVEES